MLNCVYFHITQRCQLHCRYCYFNAGEITSCAEMQTPEMLQALARLKSMKPEKIVFTGGEPMLREDLFLLASYARFFATTVLATNGLLVSEENKYEILECFDDVRVSLDGSKDRHDAYRGAGTYEKALSAARMLGDTCAVRLTYTRQDEGHVGELLNDLLEKGIRRVYTSCVRRAGRVTDDMLPSPKKIRMEEARYFCEESEEDDERTFTCGKGCCIGNYMSILPNGDIYPCHVLTKPACYIGNILSPALPELSESPVITRLIRIHDKIGSLKNNVCIGEQIGQYVEEYGFEN